MEDMTLFEDWGQLEGSMAEAKDVAFRIMHVCGLSEEPTMETLHKVEEAS